MRFAYRHYMVIVLMTILGFSYVDRLVFGVVQQSIKEDLGLTDTQLGVLSGVGFTLFFALVGVPIARWADKGNRITIVTLTTAVWSVCVALCAFATGFVHLFLIRIGIAAGEAGCQPPASSLIPDYFSRAERPRAVARYMLGGSLGTMVGYFAGGWLNQLYGWRTTFILIGLPGLALAALASLTLREPRLQKAASISPDAQPSRDVPGFKEVVITLARNATFRNLLLAFLVWYFCGWALLQWIPTFFIRSHGMATGELGTWLATVWGVCGLVSVWLGGEWGSRTAARNERLQLAVAAVLFAITGGLYACVFLTSTRSLALSMLALAAITGGLCAGPLHATLQTLVAPRMRATASALVTLLPSLVGAGFGPMAAGMISDGFHAWLADESLRYALLIMCPGFCWAGWHLWRASRTIFADLVTIREDGESAASGVTVSVR